LGTGISVGGWSYLLLLSFLDAVAKYHIRKQCFLSELTWIRRPRGFTALSKKALSMSYERP
jgi:hypothetical protein